MTRWALLVLFFVMLAGDMLGLNVGIAPGLSVKNACFYVIVLPIAIEAAVTRNRRAELISVIAPYSLFMIYAAFSSLVIVLLIDRPGYDALTSVMSLKNRLADNLLMFLVCFYGVLNTTDALRLLRGVIWIVLILNVICLMDYLNLPDLGLLKPLKGDRLGGPMGEPNMYAAFLVLFGPAMVALARLERGVRRKIVIFGILVSALALLLTGSRGGLAGLVFGTAMASLYLRRFISARAFRVAFGGVIGVLLISLGVLFAAGYLEPLHQRFIGESVGSDAYGVSAGRTVIWGSALGMMLDHPISLVTGLGWDAYFQSSNLRFAPHNSYLHVYFELGMIGLLLLTLTLVNLFRTARATLKRTDTPVTLMLMAFVFGLAAHLVSIFFVDVSWLLTWAYAGVAMRLAVGEQITQNPGVRRAFDNSVVSHPGMDGKA